MATAAPQSDSQDRIAGGHMKIRFAVGGLICLLLLPFVSSSMAYGGSESIMLQLENPVAVIEGFDPARQFHRLDVWQIHAFDFTVSQSVNDNQPCSICILQRLASHQGCIS
jgi:hypothetical protein